MNKINVEEYLTHLEYLVNIDSGSHHPEGVSMIANFFHKRYEKIGWTVLQKKWNDKVAPCLEITNTNQEQYDILLIGHMDTVFPVGTAQARPFAIRDDRAYGPGVNDMKSGCLLMYYALRSLHEQKLLDDILICVAMNSDEEISSIYSRSWIEGLAQKAKYAFILEPARPNGALVNGRKGLGRFNLTFKGLAAHAGVEPEKGINAVNEMAHWITVLHGLTDTLAGTNVNVGLVAGGIAANVVADHAEAKVDLRFRTMAEYQRIADKVYELQQCPVTPGIHVQVEGMVTRPPMNLSEQTKALCETVHAISEEIAVPITWTQTGGGSDGNFTAYHGVPTIDGLGPVGGGSHSISEYLEIASIDPRFRLLSNIILRIGREESRK